MDWARHGRSLREFARLKIITRTFTANQSVQFSHHFDTSISAKLCLLESSFAQIGFLMLFRF